MPRHEPEILPNATAAAVRRKVLPLSEEMLRLAVHSAHDPVSQAVASGVAVTMIVAAHFPPERTMAVVERICEMMLENTRLVLERLDKD